MKGQRKLTVLDYWWDNNRPYQNVPHDSDTAEKIDVFKLLDTLFEGAGVKDGDEVTITVTKTGRRPFGNRRMRLVAPHTYELDPPEAA